MEEVMVVLKVVAMEISGSILKDGWKNLVLFLEEGLFTKMYAEGQSKGGVAVRNMMMDMRQDVKQEVFMMIFL